MTDTNASVLVAGGAVTVLVCPLLAQRLIRSDRLLLRRKRAAKTRVSGPSAPWMSVGVSDTMSRP